jgi:lipoprotein-anchoring transpeptidase ErfK/SrfK
VDRIATVRPPLSFALLAAAFALTVVGAAGCSGVSSEAETAEITPIVARESTWDPPNPPATTLPRLEDLQPELAAAMAAYQLPSAAPAPSAAPGSPSGSPAEAAPPPAPPTPIARSKLEELPIYAGAADTAPTRALRNPTAFGSPLTLLVVGADGPSLQVALPLRPNGATGWVRATDVDVIPVDDRIDIDLAARQLTWTRAGAQLMQHAVAIGAPGSPTPAGLFFVTDVVDRHPSGPYGPWAIALSGYSETYRAPESEGDYRIAIHGTNRPDSIGKNVSQGCARLPNPLVTTLAAGVPLGTPVTIH